MTPLIFYVTPSVQTQYSVLNTGLEFFLTYYVSSVQSET